MSHAARLRLGTWLLAWSATTAQAQATTRLSWQRAAGAESCIDDTQLEAAVEAQLAADALSHDDDAELVIAGRVERTSRPRGFRAVVSVLRAGSVTGVRDVVVLGRDCRKLDDALVLVIAMALEHEGNGAAAALDRTTTSPEGSSGDRLDRVTGATGSATDAPSTSSAEPSVTEAATTAEDDRGQRQSATNAPVGEARARRQPPPREAGRNPLRRRPPKRPTPLVARRAPMEAPAPRAAEPRDNDATTNDDAAPPVDPAELAHASHWSLSAGGAVSSGWMPGPAAGASAAVAWRASSSWSVELAGVWWPAGEQPTDMGSMHLAIGYAQARLCPSLWRGKVWIDACAGLDVGAIAAEGRGFDRDNRSDRRWLFGTAAALRLAAPLTGTVWLRGVVAIDVPWRRERYVVARGSDAQAEQVELHRIAGVTGALGLELLAHL